MQQPQSRPLLGDSVSGTTTSPTARHNPVTVLTHQQLQQLQQLQTHSTTAQAVTFALQQPSNNNQEGNGSTSGNHIVYLNQVNQLNHSQINPSGTGMGLPPATPAFGVGLNMGLPLSLFNTSLTSLTSNVITTSNPLLNLSIPSINSGLAAINPNLNTLNALNSNLNASVPSDSINNGITNLGQEINVMNSAGISRLSTLSSTSISSGLSGISELTSVNPNLTSLNPNITQKISSSVTNISSASRPLNVLATTPIQSIQSIAPHIVSSASTQLSSSTSCAGPILSTTSSNNQQVNVPQFSIMSSNLSSIVSSQITSSDANQQANFAQQQRQFSSPSGQTATIIPNIKTMQNIQGRNTNSPGSPFSMPLKSPASNIAPPTPSPSPNRLLLRSPASNSMQSARNSPSPVAATTPNASFNIQMQSPMQSPISVGQIQSPAPSPYPPAKSPHPVGTTANTALNNRSPASAGSPGPPVQVRSTTPLLQQGMQVLQIIHGNPSGFASAPTQLVTRTHLFGNQQIQIASTKAAKQPPQILPKPSNQQGNIQQQKQRVSTTITTNQVPQQTQPQLVLGPQPSQTMIPTQGLLLNQVLPSTGPVIVQQQPGGVQLILRAPANAQQQTHTAQLTQQQLVRVVTAQGISHLQGITPTFFAVPNGFQSPAAPVIRTHTPSSPAPQNTGNANSIVIQNAMVQSPQPQITTHNNQVSLMSGNVQNNQAIIDHNLLPPPKKKAKKKKKAKRKDDEAPKLDLASIMKISGIGVDDDLFDNDLNESDNMMSCSQPENTVQNSPQPTQIQQPQPTQSPVMQQNAPVQNQVVQIQANTGNQGADNFNSQLIAQLQMPVQNAISGQLRLAVGEDGRVVLHHTPEPNQPELDPATAQALLRSLTQSGGQNSPIISQLLGQAQPTQHTIQVTQQRQKFVKSPISSNVPSSSPQHVVTIPVSQSTQMSFDSVSPGPAKSPQIQKTDRSPCSKPVVRSVTCVQQPKCNQTANRAKNQGCVQPIGQRVKPVQQKTVQCTTVQRNVQVVKNSLESSEPVSIYQQNVAQQISTHTVQNVQMQNVQNIFEQNLQQNVNMASTQRCQDGMKVDAMFQQNTNVQQAINVLQPSVQTLNSDQMFGGDNMERQKVKINTTNYEQNAQGMQQQNILISNNPPCNNEPAKSEAHPVMNSTATNIINSAPKISPEILNALSNLNPNDQLLIANANGQMQVISQQLLQQFLSGQLNQNQNQNQQQQQQNQQQNQSQPQKIVIGEPETGTQNLQGLQIHTPTSQIIVNSSGGAPTIQNNIQNIVVQASQMPHQIQIQNSGFPSQFIDNLNQQQMKNMTTTQPTPQPAQTPKKPKVVKKKVVAVSQPNVQSTTKTEPAVQPRPVTISDRSNRPAVVAVGVCRPHLSNQQPPQQQQKVVEVVTRPVNFISQNVDPNKNTGENAPETATTKMIPATSPCATPTTPSQTGQVVQRIQTIQLTVQKQMMLKNIQMQIQTILARKSNSQQDQMLLTKLYQEQTKILASGKVLSNLPHHAVSEPENATSNVSSSSISQISTCKNQTSTVQTQTQSQVQSAPSVAVSATNQNVNMNALAMQNISSESNNMFLGNIAAHQTPTNVQNMTIQQSPNKQHILHQQQQIPLQHQQPAQLHQQQQQLNHQQQQPQLRPCQTLSSQMPNPSMSSGAYTSTTMSQSTIPPTMMPTHHIQQQQSTQCQTDPIDVKPIIEIQSPVKEVPTPIQVQVTNPPATQTVSPRLCAKSNQNLQTPAVATVKPLMSPNSSTRGVKRPATSPVCRQVNRSELLEQQMKIDQTDVLNPDVNTPFTSKRDACKRLLKYHVFDEPVLSEKDLLKADDLFEETAKHLLNKFSSMRSKFQYLLMMESTREVRSSEVMMIDRMFVADEQVLLNKLKDQNAKVKANEEFMKEEKLLVPKVESDLSDMDGLLPTLSGSASVKLELNDDEFVGMETDEKPLVKSSVCSGDYDEWLEIQKELGVYTPSPSDGTKCRTLESTKSSKSQKRVRANGDSRGERDSFDCISEGRANSATDLERDLLEDTESLDGLGLYSSQQCASTSTDAAREHDITAQVQSAIDSILNLKKRPASTQLSGSSNSGAVPGSSTPEPVIDQAVRSIIGS